MSRRSALPLTLAVVALSACCLSQLAFVMGAGRTATQGASVARQVNIFEGFSLPDTQGSEPSGETGWDGARSAREVGADDKGRIVECNMPLGIQFEERAKGDIYIKDVDQNSDAWDQGVRPGAQLTFVSATFGDEMWNTKGVGMTQFMTVLRSRFGSTIKIALEKENKSLLGDFFASLGGSQEKTKKTTKSQEELMAEFESTEKDLGNKQFWNPFR